MSKTSIRRFSDEDAEAIALVFFNSVRHGTKTFYNVAQRNAWASKIPDTLKWRGRLNAQSTYVAERGGKLTGFMTVNDDGYIDLAFVAPDAIGHGVGKLLYDRIGKEALSLGATRLHSEASHLARAFFERQGWSVICEQTISRCDVTLTNFLMEKHLG